jgi:hypothetical protein
VRPRERLIDAIIEAVFELIAKLGLDGWMWRRSSRTRRRTFLPLCQSGYGDQGAAGRAAHGCALEATDR